MIAKLGKFMRKWDLEIWAITSLALLPFCASGCAFGLERGQPEVVQVSKLDERKQCDILCHKKYGTDVQYIGYFTGTCYCKE
jgi:hypothetical protein